MGTITIEEETIPLKPDGKATVVLWTTTGDMMAPSVTVSRQRKRLRSIQWNWTIPTLAVRHRS
uniref:Uncharacterized protein n=1 Tax=mine drainage metagenome TaxID=410659 RepID=E6QLY6_9ZZZZ